MISGINANGLNVMLKTIQGLEGDIFANLSGTYVYGDVELAKIAVQLSKHYLDRMLPRIHEVGNLRQQLFFC